MKRTGNRISCGCSEDTYLARIREKSESFDTTECRQTSERLYLQITYQLAATANSESDDAETQVKIGMCRNVIDEINLLIKDFKLKAYRKNDNDNDDDNFDEDAEEEALTESTEHTENN